MYSIDGVPLSNPGLGWRLKRGSEPWVSRGLDRPDFNASNRDGTTSVRGHVTTPVLTLVVRAPGSTVEALRLLLRRGTSLTLTSNPNVELVVQAVTVSHVTVAVAGGGLHEVTVVYRAPGVWWRDVSTVDYTSAMIPTSSSPGAQSMTVLTTTTGAVQDAIVVVKGALQTPRISGGNSTWLEYDAFANGWLRFDTSTGRAWMDPQPGDGADCWTDTSNEVTANVNSGSYPYFLELFPSSTAPGCTLTLTYSNVVAGQVIVRAKNAYDR